MSVPVAIVVAAAENGVIGRDNGLIWRLKSDLKHFRALTIGRPLIMGRKTFDSIGRPLPGRETIVLTRDPGFAVDQVHVVHDCDEALALGQSLAARMGADSVCVGGGGEVYRLLLPHTDRIHFTRVATRPAGDTHFPDIDPTAFRLAGREDHPAGPDDEFAFSFLDYVRR